MSPPSFHTSLLAKLKPSKTNLKAHDALEDFFLAKTQTLPGVLGVDLFSYLHAVHNMFSDRKDFAVREPRSKPSSSLGPGELRYYMLRALEAGPDAQLHDLSHTPEFDRLLDSHRQRALEFLLSVPLLQISLIDIQSLKRRYDLFELYPQVKDLSESGLEMLFHLAVYDQYLDYNDPSYAGAKDKCILLNQHTIDYLKDLIKQIKGISTAVQKRL